MTEILYAPSRMAYVLKKSREKGCVFCRAFRARDDRQRFVLLRDKSCFVVMNLYPYNSGHVMVVPNRHVASLGELGAQEKAEIWSLSDRMIRALEKTMKPHGFNLGLNIGKAAGAGIDDHLHLHVVPRWEGDTNFITVLFDVKVVPEALLHTYDKLKQALEKNAGSGQGG